MPPVESKPYSLLSPITRTTDLRHDDADRKQTPRTKQTQTAHAQAEAEAERATTTARLAERSERGAAMGCGPSKEDTDGGAASRCREQKHLLRAAVQARHALAGAHAGHAAALRNVGAALSDYAAGETDRHDAAVVPRSASAAAALGGTAAVAAPAALKALPPPPLDAVLPPPPPPPSGAEDAAGPLQRSMSAPDIQLQANIRKARSGEAPIMEEEEGEGEGEGREDAAPLRRRKGLDDTELQPPPPPPPANAPPPSRSPPPVPDRKPAPKEGNSFTEYIFGSSDAAPMPPPTLDPGAEPSWAGERRDPAPPPPPQSETDRQPPPPPETVAEGKKLAVEPAARRAATQKASRKADGKKARIAMVAPQPVRLGDVLRRLDEHFLKASEGAHEVSKMLEAARMHYHSNFADKRGTFHACSAPDPIL